jgi:hypothetical protein
VTNIRDLLPVARPLLSAVAHFMTALAEEEKGRSGNPARKGQGAASFIHAGSNLIDAVNQINGVLSSSTSNGQTLAPSRPSSANLSGSWGDDRNTVVIYHDDDTGLFVIKDGGEVYFGGAQFDGRYTGFVATCSTSDRRNMLWHGVASGGTMATTLWNWDARTNSDFRLDRV